MRRLVGKIIAKGKPDRSERGISVIGLAIIILAILALVWVGFSIFGGNNENTGGNGPGDSSAQCDYDDQDLCRFFANYKSRQDFTINSVQESDGQTVNIILRADGKDKSHLTVDGSSPYEVITIDQNTFTKAEDSTWWKQTTENQTVDRIKNDVDIQLKEPTEGSGVTYEKMGKEACGDLTCFKYQVSDQAMAGATVYIWFDDQDYLLRRIQLTRDGTKIDSSFSYDEVQISEPSPVKDLGEGQQILPGQGAPSSAASGREPSGAARDDGDAEDGETGGASLPATGDTLAD